MDKSNRDKPAIKPLSYNEVIGRLESARKEYKEFDEGHRKALYQSMQRVAEAAVSVLANENIKTRYRKEMGKKDALRAALTFIFDAKSTIEKKDASKRSLALWYLIEKLKVSVEAIAKAIPKNGGVAKLASLAAKSREDDADEDQDKEEGDEGQEDEDQDEPEEADENDKAEHKFGKRITVGLSPKLTKKLNRFADKTRIKIIGYIRMSSDGSPTIEVKNILEAAAKKKNSKSKTRKAGEKPDDDESDWQD
jgi:hypothetical protein